MRPHSHSELVEIEVRTGVAAMIHRVVSLSAILLAGMGLVIPSHAADVNRTTILKGRCSSLSNRAAICDSVTFIYPADYKDYVMILFGQNGQRHPVFGFSGKLIDDGVLVMVDHIYLANGEIETGKGSCKFFFQNHRGWESPLTALECGQPDWVFDVDPGQDSSTSSPPPSGPSAPETK